MNYLNINEAREAYKKNQNVTEFLREKFGANENTSEIIEMAYDLQAGSYIQLAYSDFEKMKFLASQISVILAQYLNPSDSLLDVGTGELTNFTLTLNNIGVELSRALAFDISWSRLSKGVAFYRENNVSPAPLEVFVADIKAVPLASKCVDVVTSNAALEPNGRYLPVLLKELFRVAKKKLVLFEPSYELNTDEGRKRMDSLGYIKNIEQEVRKLGGIIDDVIPIEHVRNPLNPKACYVITPPECDQAWICEPLYCVPGSDFSLTNDGNFMLSKDTGLVFPILDEIPVLRESAAILATAKFF